MSDRLRKEKMKVFRLCSHVIKYDTGLAPNPFWDYCTLAVCTPNHMNIKLKSGDWLVGFSPVSKGSRMIYAMEVDEILDFDIYFRDLRFRKKRPNIKGDWKERCGDNMYYKDPDGKWKQTKTIYHRKKEEVEKDLKHPMAYIAKHFYFFGENALNIPDILKDLVWKRQGVKCNHDTELINKFTTWLAKEYSIGIHGMPRDNCERY